MPYPNEYSPYATPPFIDPGLEEDDAAFIGNPEDADSTAPAPAPSAPPVDDPAAQATPSPKPSQAASQPPDDDSTPLANPEEPAASGDDSASTPTSRADSTAAATTTPGTGFATPETDALMALYNKRAQMPVPSVKRRIGAELTSLIPFVGPTLAQQVLDPTASQFRRDVSLGQARSNLELQQLQKEGQIANIQSEIASRAAMASTRQYYDQARAQNYQSAEEDRRNKLGEILVPAGAPDITATPGAQDAPPNYFNLPLANPEQPPVTGATPGANVPPGMVPLLSPANRPPAAANQPPPGYFKVPNLPTDPPGTVRYRPTAAQLALEKKQATQNVTEAGWQDIGDDITNALHLPKGLKVPPTVIAPLAEAYLKSLQPHDPTEVGLALQASGGDPVKALQLYAKTKQQSTNIKINQPADTAMVDQAADSVYQNPEYFQELSGDFKNAVAQRFTQKYNLPAPAKISTQIRDRADLSQRALEQINTVRQLIQDPEVQQRLGPALGRIGNAEQDIGATAGLSPEAAQKIQRLRSALTYLVFGEGNAIFGSRIPQQLMGEFKGTSANVKQSMPLLLGSLQSSEDFANNTITAAEKSRFGGKMRPTVANAITPPAPSAPLSPQEAQAYLQKAGWTGGKPTQAQKNAAAKLAKADGRTF